MNIVYLADIERTEWLNRGGYKRDLLVADEILISIADITQDGPFSFYQDQQRFFAIIDGAGVALGEPAIRLTTKSPVHEFEGEQAPACHLIDGATIALNLMCKRSQVAGALVRLPPTNACFDLRFEASQFSGIIGVFTIGAAVLTEHLNSGTCEHVLSSPCLAWQDSGASHEPWSLRPLSSDDCLDAFSLRCVRRA